MKKNDSFTEKDLFPPYPVTILHRALLERKKESRAPIDQRNAGKGLRNAISFNNRRRT